MIKSRLPYDSDLSSDQIDKALRKLTNLMMTDDEKPKEKNKPSKIQVQDEFDDPLLKSIQDLAKEVSQLNQPKENEKLSKEHQAQIISRLYDKHFEALNKLESLRELQEKPNETFKPKINQASQKIIKKKIEQGDYMPIQKRVEQIQANKKDKYEAALRLKTLQQIEQDQNCTFQPHLETSSEYSQYSYFILNGHIFLYRNQYQEHRPVEQFLEEVDYYIRKKNNYIQTQLQDQFCREMKKVTFRPEINPQSEWIVSQSKELNAPVEERLQRSLFNKQLKNKQLIEQEMKSLSFKPKLNNNSVKMVQKNQKEIINIPIHERLYIQAQAKKNEVKKQNGKQRNGCSMPNAFESINPKMENSILENNKNYINIQNNSKSPRNTTQQNRFKNYQKSPYQKEQSVSPIGNRSFRQNKSQITAFDDNTNIRFVIELIDGKKQQIY